MARKRRRQIKSEGAPTDSRRGDPAEDGPYLYTFTFRLPFMLGISDTFDQDIGWAPPYADPRADTTFGRPPFVRLRLFNAATSDRKFSPVNAAPAVRRFYNRDFPVPDTDPTDPHLLEQWVSVETPAALLKGENRADGAYAFHRCLSALAMYLQAFAIARDDDRVRPISARELRPIVIIGRLGLDGSWDVQGPMLIHPDAKGRESSSRPVSRHAESLNSALDVMMSGNPFVRSWQWKARAERRRYEGDNADAVVSFQAAAEVFLYELWALMLADEGCSSEQISERRQSTPYATLVKAELSHRLGGSWDITQLSTAVGKYWRHLYELRGRVVHGGYLPHDGDAEAACRSFRDLESFVIERLQQNAKRYPIAAGRWQQLTDVTGTT